MIDPDRTDCPHWGDDSEPTRGEEIRWWIGVVIAFVAACLLAWRLMFYFFGG